MFARRIGIAKRVVIGSTATRRRVVGEIAGASRERAARCAYGVLMTMQEDQANDDVASEIWYQLRQNPGKSSAQVADLAAMRLRQNLENGLACWLDLRAERTIKQEIDEMLSAMLEIEPSPDWRKLPRTD